MRGGSRNVGKRMPSNRSNLVGVWFKRENNTVYVHSSAGERRTRISLHKHGQRRAIEKALKFRRDAGLPTDSVRAAIRALHIFEALCELRFP